MRELGKVKHSNIIDLKEFLVSSLESSLHPIAISESPMDETLGQPRISRVFSFAHFESEISERSVISVQ
jgi:hypothetical protein